jgi:small-conductance mechanosensitive channel
VRVRRATIITGIAVAGLVVSANSGGPLGGAAAHHSPVYRLIAVGSAAVFLVFALIAVRGATQDLLALLPHAFGDTRMAGLRVICLLGGYALVIIGALSLLHVPWSRLLLGGALTGVILGIAAQPVLGNVCAGLVLLIARPFTVGEEITVQSGPLGGRIEGRVGDMTLLFVELHTSDGRVLLPNNAVLGAAIGPPEHHSATAGGTSGR